MPAAENFTIRLATTEDIPALATLIDQSVRKLQQHDYTPAVIEAALGFAFTPDLQLIADQTYFVATPINEPETLAAAGGWSFRKKLCGGECENPAPLSPETDAAKIRAFFVHPKFARQGLGSLLLSHCEAAAKSAGFTRTEMGSTLTGVNLYLRHGYMETDRFTVPLPNGESLPVVHMTKTLA